MAQVCNQYMPAAGAGSFNLFIYFTVYVNCYAFTSKRRTEAFGKAGAPAIIMFMAGLAYYILLHTLLTCMAKNRCLPK